MLISSITQKGQVTIPAVLKEKLDLHPGDVVEFQLEDHTIKVIKRKKDIKSAFGLIKVNKKVTLEDMERAIQKGALDDID